MVALLGPNSRAASPTFVKGCIGDVPQRRRSPGLNTDIFYGIALVILDDHIVLPPNDIYHTCPSRRALEDKTATLFHLESVLRLKVPLLFQESPDRDVVWCT